MPALEKHIVQKIIENEKYPCFIESGTWKGHTIFNMEDLFDKLYTIEIVYRLFKKASDKYTGNKISFKYGDSTVILKDIIDEVTTNAIFFLDGHYSGEFTSCNDKHVPLYEELKLIVEKFKYNAIIIIDDYRLFGMSTDIADWSNINKHTILSIIGTRLIKTYNLPSVYHPEDRLIIELKSIET